MFVGGGVQQLGMREQCRLKKGLGLGFGKVEDKWREKEKK